MSTDRSIKVLDEAEIERGISHLRAADPLLAELIDRIERRPPPADSSGSHFEALVRAIVYQQISGRAAETIHGRVIALLDGRSPDPGTLAAVEEGALRAAGLSRQKAAYIKDLAARSLSGELPVESLHQLEDESVIEELTKVKGVGRWSAHMFLLFRLGRPDILSELDLGIRKGIQKVYGLDALPDASEVQRIGAPWSPYRSIASWYLWRSLE